MRRWGRRNARRYSLWASFLALLGYRRMIQGVVAGLPAGGMVADIGCGDGEALRFLAAERPHLAVVALDLSPEFLSRARARHPRAHLVCANAEHLPLRPGSCTAALSFGVLGHLVRAEGAVAAQVSILRPGGTFAVWTRTGGPFSRLVAAAFERENPGVAFVLHDAARLRSCLEALGAAPGKPRSIAGGVLLTGQRNAR
jgi:malonyl-CoA O-methyltransferase